MNIDNLLGQMTLAEKVGQLFLLAFSGSRLDEARVLIVEQMVGAAYISNDNVPTSQAALHLTQQLQAFARQTRLKIPLILGVDQEGAWAVMVPDSSPGPGNMALGATSDPRFAHDMYRVIGTELTAVGLNTVFAPCADCNSNPHNAIIGMRSFGQPPALVADMVAAAVQGAHEGGVITSVKHFPGHGDTTIDSHRGLPLVNRDRDTLYALDLLPFRRGIEAGTDMVMTAHIRFPALDADYPATLSPTILQDVLRSDLGFEGVILSDSMNMGAMKRSYEPAWAVVQALRAGVDLIMLAEEHYDHDAARYLDQQRALIYAVIASVESGSLPASRVDDAVRRVLWLKANAGLFDAPVPNADTAPGIVGSAAHRAVELEAARHAIAVLRDDRGLLPLAADQPAVLVNTTARSSYAVLGSTRGIGPNQVTPAFDLFAQHLNRLHPVTMTLDAEVVLDGAAVDGSAIIVAVTENYPLPGVDFDQTSQGQVIQRLLDAAGDRLVVVALRDPYELQRLPPVPAYLCAFSFRPCAARAAAEALCGLFTPTGKSPVSL